MLKIFTLATLIFSLNFSLPALANAQSMMNNQNMMGNNNTAMQITDADDHTAREEAAGKAIWGKLQNNTIQCANLTTENFGALGEYFMGQMAGDSHEAMNNMMTQMMGAEGEEEMHVAMGKRMSECEPNAAMPQGMMNSGMMQMMMGSGMMGDWTNSSTRLNNFNNLTSMMNFGFAPFGWLFMILFWILIIAGVMALIKWIAGQSKTVGSHNSALDILQERYAKGEINKKEFTEKKKDLEGSARGN